MHSRQCCLLLLLRQAILRVLLHAEYGPWCAAAVWQVSLDGFLMVDAASLAALQARQLASCSACMCCISKHHCSVPLDCTL